MKDNPYEFQNVVESTIFGENLSSCDSKKYSSFPLSSKSYHHLSPTNFLFIIVIFIIIYIKIFTCLLYF